MSIELGQVVELGRHRLMRGDAFDIGHVKNLLGDSAVDMLYCDPPYGMRLNPDWSQTHGMAQGGKYAPVRGDDGPFDPSGILAYFQGVGEQFWWGADYYAEAIPLRNEGSLIVWDKRLTESADRMYGSCFEICWSKKRHKRDFVRLKWAGLFGLEREPEKRRLHPNQKPVALAEWFISRFSRKGDTILDLFGGSGSTLLACERTGRTCLTMEIDGGYADLIASRYENRQQLLFEAA